MYKMSSYISHNYTKKPSSVLPRNQDIYKGSSIFAVKFVVLFLYLHTKFQLNQITLRGVLPKPLKEMVIMSFMLPGKYQSNLTKLNNLYQSTSH